MSVLRVLLIAVVVGVVLAGAPAALAAPPANDNRLAAQVLSAGDDVQGTTVEATREANEPPACPAKGGPTVWYRYNAPRGGTARLLLETAGGLDASIAVYEQDKSTLTRIGCGTTRRGTLLATVGLEDSGPYLIRVAQQPDSQPGTFRLRFSGVLTEPTPPGTPLGVSGIATGKLNPLTRPFAQFSRRLRAGHDYRVRVDAVGGSAVTSDDSGDSGDGSSSDDTSDDSGRAVAAQDDSESCNVTVTLYRPGGEPDRTLSCRDYTVITPSPDEAGVWTIGLSADDGDGSDIPFTASITGVGSDDLAPGHFLGAFGVAHGVVSGRLPDAEDVYRFDVTKRAEITLKLASAGGMSVTLRTDSGRAVTSAAAGDELRTRLKPGRFYAIVSAASDTGGRYTLSRLTRVITSTKVDWGSSRQAPGGSGTVHVHVSGAHSGRAIVKLERFDPQYGWRYWQQRTVRISGGDASFSVDTSAIGRYRAIAQYLGSRDASPSQARRAGYLRVVAALQERR